MNARPVLHYHLHRRVSAFAIMLSASVATSQQKKLLPEPFSVQVDESQCRFRRTTGQNNVFRERR